MNLTQLSHAAAEGSFPPCLADWVHAMAAAIWMGGLLGFVVALFSGPLGALARPYLHTPLKNPHPVSQPQAYIAYLLGRWILCKSAPFGLGNKPRNVSLDA